MLEKMLAEKDYLPITVMADGSMATRNNWGERRAEMISLLEEYSYGQTPQVPIRVKGISNGFGKYTCAGKCTEEFVDVVYTTPRGEGVIPIQVYTPVSVDFPSVLLHLAFGKAPHMYIPVEEIIDHGYALVVVDYQDMVNDNHFGDYSDGIADHFATTNKRKNNEWGKIGMWAWGASRILDYLIQQRTDLNTKQTALIGHSRLGKTALWCAAQDERFCAVISNNSGYGGAASSKHGNGERIDDFIRVGSWDWFCENFKRFSGELEDEKPYDQSFLLALIAPRYLLIGSAELDSGADPTSEFLTALHASDAWELLGKKGLICDDVMPRPGDCLGDGNILYHYRAGTHFLSLDDWKAYMRFLDSKFKS